MTAAETGSGERLPGSVDVALLFCDLKDFTPYVDTEGDEAAVAAIDRFTDTVARERGESFRFMKSLGDGVMLSYGDAPEAVAAGARVIAGMRAEGMPRVHASVHNGVAITREGDYFGGAVNLAARLLVVAGPDELLATRPAVEATGDSRGSRPDRPASAACRPRPRCSGSCAERSTPCKTRCPVREPQMTADWTMGCPLGWRGCGRESSTVP